MRWAKSYSIVDHQLLHAGYLHELSHQALALYLFLLVVSDREGKSFYAHKTIVDILRFSPSSFRDAAKELISSKLITYSRPNFWVNNLEAGDEQRKAPRQRQRATAQQCPIPTRYRATEFSSDCRGTRNLSKTVLGNLLHKL